MLFFLSGKFPIFAASSDMEALMEQAAILGRDIMENTAASHSETRPPQRDSLIEGMHRPNFQHKHHDCRETDTLVEIRSNP